MQHDSDECATPKRKSNEVSISWHLLCDGNQAYFCSIKRNERRRRNPNRIVASSQVPPPEKTIGTNQSLTMNWSLTTNQLLTTWKIPCTLSDKNIWRSGEPGCLAGKSAGLVIERLWVRIPAGAAGEFSSLVSTLCADSHLVSVPSPCYRSDTQKTPVILLKVQVAGYT